MINCGFSTRHKDKVQRIKKISVPRSQNYPAVLYLPRPADVHLVSVPVLLLPALVNVDGLARPRPRLVTPGLLVDDDDAVVPGLGLGRPQRDVLREVGAQTQVITRLAVFFGLENVETLDGKTFNSHERKWSRPSFTQLTTFQFHVYNSTPNMIYLRLPGSCRRGCGWRGPPWPPGPSACCSSRCPHRPWAAPPRLYCPQILDITSRYVRYCIIDI